LRAIAIACAMLEQSGFNPSGDIVIRQYELRSKFS